MTAAISLARRWFAAGCCCAAGACNCAVGHETRHHPPAVCCGGPGLRRVRGPPPPATAPAAANADTAADIPEARLAQALALARAGRHDAALAIYDGLIQPGRIDALGQ